MQQIEANTKFVDAGITGNPTLFAQFTAQVNNYYSKATHIIITSTGIWEWDDTNHVNLASATTNIAEDQLQYQVMNSAPETDEDWLQVKGVNVKNESGQWYKLFYRAEKDNSMPREEIERTTSGQPTSYYFEGTQIFLDVKPSYSADNSLQVLFDRAPLYFTVEDTTKRPGFNTLYHEYLVLGGTYWWEKFSGVGNPEQTKRDLKEIEITMGKFYNNRNEYSPNRLRNVNGRLSGRFK